MIDWSARVIMENRAELDEAFPTENILSWIQRKEHSGFV
jgi:hypothetical protein